MPMTTPTGRRRGRAGFSLVELIVVIVLVGVVMGALYRVIDRQQRFYAGMGDVMTQRLQLRQASTLLPLELRSLSTIGGDILAFSDSTIEMRTHIGSSIICAIVSPDEFVVPPLVMANGQTLTSFTSRPVGGDDVFIYDDGLQTGNLDDSWIEDEVSSLTEDSGVCVGAPYTLGADNGKSRFRVKLTGALITPTVDLGAPVRFVRQVKYSLYKASDSNWYLGLQSWNGATYDTVEPVSGPYDPATGIKFSFYKEDGTLVTTVADADEIARVDFLVKGTTSGQVKVDGMQKGQYADSLAVSVAIRNRR